MAGSPLQFIDGIGRLVVEDALGVGDAEAVGVEVSVAVSVGVGSGVDTAAVAFFSSERRSLIVCCWAKILIKSSAERPLKNHFTRSKSTRVERNIR